MSLFGLTARFLCVLPLDLTILALRVVWISALFVNVMLIRLRFWIVNDIPVKGVEHEREHE